MSNKVKPCQKCLFNFIGVHFSSRTGMTLATLPEHPPVRYIMSQQTLPNHLPRLGFHYFPDTVHYRQSDLSVWLPVLRALGASWLTLIAPANRAIPEFFLSTLLANGIEPILHHHLSLESPPSPQDLHPIFQAYARWGVRYIVLFDRPNRRAAWPPSIWAQKHLVERFLDLYLPLAEVAQQAGLIPVFPPLEPGGDFWDTAFIRLSAQSLRRRKYASIPDPWVLSCYAWASNRPLDWGAGGPERWPGARPYGSPAGEQDQCGFRIFEWYLALAQAELNQACAILLLGAGCQLGDRADLMAPPVDEITHAWQNIEIARKMSEPTESSSGIPAEVLACNFWLLTTTSDSPYSRHGWFQPHGRPLPVVGAYHQWLNTLSIEAPEQAGILLAPSQSTIKGSSYDRNLTHIP
jgi:hypothetical protein